MAQLCKRGHSHASDSQAAAVASDDDDDDDDQHDDRDGDSSGMPSQTELFNRPAGRAIYTAQCSCEFMPS